MCDIVPQTSDYILIGWTFALPLLSIMLFEQTNIAFKIVGGRSPFRAL